MQQITQVWTSNKVQIHLEPLPKQASIDICSTISYGKKV